MNCSFKCCIFCNLLSGIILYEKQVFILFVISIFVIKHKYESKKIQLIACQSFYVGLVLLNSLFNYS